MIIIDARKDYYDYLVGIYGRDPKIVLDRTKHESFCFVSTRTVEVFFCGLYYQGLYHEGKYYWTEESILELGGEKRKPWYYFNTMVDMVWFKSCTIKTIPYTKEDIRGNKPGPNVPIAILDGVWRAFPCLKDIGFNQKLSPEDAYLKLIDYLSPKEMMPKPQSDKEKILSHGFDTKKSFRHR